MTIMPPGSSSMQMDPTMLSAPEHHYTLLQDIAGVGEAYSNILPTPSTVPLDRPTVRKSLEEEMEDTEDGPEWAIRVGDAPPPSWAKRKTSNDVEQDVYKKRRFHR